MTKNMTKAAQAAKQIKKKLVKAFPNTKFSVRSDNFAGGDSVDIHWTDGPTEEAVNEHAAMHQYGHFNGMNDMYYNSNVNKEIPQVRFVMTHRDMSDETRAAIIDAHNAEFCESGQIKDIHAWNADADCWNSSVVYRYFRNTSYEGAAQ